MASLTEHIDFYFDANGHMVFTEKYLSERGKCCGNGCRHCPFDYENVQDPQRTVLLQQRSGVAGKIVNCNYEREN